MAIDLKALKPHKISRDLSGYITYVYGSPGSGKAIPVDTIIPTPNGKRELGSIKVGDYVFDRLGNPTKVLGVYPQGKLDVYKVTFRDGRTVYCNDEHLWTCYTSRDNFITRTLREWMELGIEKTDARGRCHHDFAIPSCEPIEYKAQEYQIPPYVIGAFIGDGCCTERQLTISSEDGFIPSKVAKQLVEKGYGCTARKRNSENYSWRFEREEKKYLSSRNASTVLQTTEILGDFHEEIMVRSGDKCIPEIYKNGSIEQRWELIQGLFDTDGHIDGEKGRVSIFSTSKKLIDDIREVLFSLGISSSIMVDNRSEKYTTGIGFKLNVWNNSYKTRFFTLPKKAERANFFAQRECHTKEDRVQMISAEYTGEQKEMVCLYVDNPEHLFLANDYIVTHNTTLGSHFPKPLLLAFERGYNAIPGIVAQDVASWSEMKQVLRQLDDPDVKDMFKTIVIDTVDRASAACEKYVCNQIGVENIGDGGWQNNGWSKVKKEWEQTFTSLAMKGYAILFISHSKTKKFTRKDGSEYDMIIPTCPSAYNEIIKNMVDMEGYIKIDDGQRSLVFRTLDDTIECKSRFKYIEASIPFSYNSLVEAMNQAIDKEAEIHGSDFITEERETLREETTYDYDALMDEFKRITTPLLKEDAAKYGPHLTAIIEKYLGKGKKVSETTPAQADFIFLINDEIKREVLKQ
nr:MAG TPA: DNA packaging protein [Caudoviricetes sp.]